MGDSIWDTLGNFFIWVTVIFVALVFLAMLISKIGLFGKKKSLEESGQNTGGSPVRRELQRQRENTERCLAILAGCRSRDAVIKGLSQISTLLSQANDPVADAAQKAATDCRELPDEYVFQVRDDFIGQFNAFLSATEQGMKD